MDDKKRLVGRQAEIYRLLRSVMKEGLVYRRKDMIHAINSISDIPYTETLFNGSFNYLRDGKAGIVQVGRGRYVLQNSTTLTEEEYALETLAGLAVWTEQAYEPNDPDIQPVLLGFAGIAERIGQHYHLDDGTMDIYCRAAKADVCDAVWNPPNAEARLKVAERIIRCALEGQECCEETREAFAYLCDFREVFAA